MRRSQTLENGLKTGSGVTRIGIPRLRRERSPPRRSGADFRAADRHQISNPSANALASSQGLPLSSPPSMGPRRPRTRPVAPGGHDRRGEVGPLEAGSPADVLERVGMEPRENDEFVGKFVYRRQFVPIPAAGPLAAPIQSRRSASVCRRPSMSQWPDAYLPTSSGSAGRALVRWRRG